jgi:hypothetical protein
MAAYSVILHPVYAEASFRQEFKILKGAMFAPEQSPQSSRFSSGWKQSEWRSPERKHDKETNDENNAFCQNGI